jgi:hypothetical protein
MAALEARARGMAVIPPNEELELAAMAAMLLVLLSILLAAHA